MFYHSKELQFKARVSKPDPRFARLLLEQFGGGNGELKAAMQYFVQAFACHNPYPDKYDMLMDIATEELGHLEIVGATIQMLLAGVNGNLKDAAERNDVFGEGISKDDFIHSAFSVNPQFGVLTGGGPRLTDSNGVPWQGSYVNAKQRPDGRPALGHRRRIARQDRLRIPDAVHRRQGRARDTQFPDDTRSSAFPAVRGGTGHHPAQFPARCAAKRPPLQQYLLQPLDGRGCPRAVERRRKHRPGEEWLYVENPRQQVLETDGLTELEPQGTPRTEASVRSADKKLSKQRSSEIRKATPEKNLQWSQYDSQDTKAPRRQPVGQD